MSEGILKFNLDDPDDFEAHLRATKSLDMWLCLWQLHQQFVNDENDSALDTLNSILADNNIDVYELGR